MNKRFLKLFTLLTCVMLLAGVASADILNATLSGGSTNAGQALTTDWGTWNGIAPTTPQTYWYGRFNKAAGTGTFTGPFTNNYNNQRGIVEVGGVVLPNPLPGVLLQLTAPANGVLQIAPGVNNSFLAGVEPTAVAVAPWSTTVIPTQVVVNGGSNTGKVVIKGSNNDNPTVAGGYARYTGGTIALSGTLAVTNNNALGRGWVAIKHGTTFTLENTDVVRLGFNDPAGNATLQPVFLLNEENDFSAGIPKLVSATINVDELTTNKQRMEFLHGLSQRLYVSSSPAIALAAGTPVNRNDGTNKDFLGRIDSSGLLSSTIGRDGTVFSRLVKVGTGTLYIKADGKPLPTGRNNFNTMVGYRPIPGAHHMGGTDVLAGVLDVDGGNATSTQDHFRGSLGRFWQETDGVLPTAPTTAYNPIWFFNNVKNNATAAVNGGFLYNPLKIDGNATLKVNRSQFFSDFNSTSGTLFSVNQYSLAGTNYRPQITVTLNLNDSVFNGTLDGYIDFVLNSRTAGGTSLATANPSSWVQSPSVSVPGQAILTLGNAENTITTGGQTLIANGILHIAGTKSIGDGLLTIGADNFDTAGTGPRRGFTTLDSAVFAATETMTIPNVTVVNETGQESIFSFAGVAANDGKVLTFKNITLNNDHAAATNFVTINPTFVRSPAWGAAILQPMPKSWIGTVVFGAASSADARYAFAGTMRNPTRVYVERGVLTLNAAPVRTATQNTNNEDGFATISIFDHTNAPQINWPGAVAPSTGSPYSTGTLAFGKGVQDMTRYLDINVADDSRIRVVVLNENIAASQLAAHETPATLEVHNMDYTLLGQGQSNRDKRMVIEIDLEDVSILKKGSVVPLLRSKTATAWNNLHFLRENSAGATEDYPKVTVSFPKHKDINKDSGVRIYLNEDTWEIGIEILEDLQNDDPNPPVPGKDVISATLSATPATVVDAGQQITFMLGKWTYKPAVGAEVEDVIVTLGDPSLTGSATMVSNNLATDGTYVVTVNADAADLSKVTLSVPASYYPTLGGAAVTGNASATVTVNNDDTPTPTPTPSGGGSSGGCDAGFAGLALLLAAPLFLRKKD